MTNKDFFNGIQRVNAFLTVDVLIGVALFVFAFFVLGKLEVEGLQRFTTDWFWPVGAVVAASGAVVAFVISMRRRQLVQFLIVAFLFAFLPGLVQFLLNGVQDTPSHLKVLLSSFLMLAPWLLAPALYLDKSRAAND
jgi:hypothetical protein